MKKHTYSGKSLNEISFPIGGIGTGSIGLSGNGRLVDWEIYNIPSKNTMNGYTHFAIKAENLGKLVDARVLMGDIQKDLTGHGDGVPNCTMAGFPHFRGCEFTGEYPFATINFTDKDFPGKAKLRAYNPLIPMDGKNSSIPACFFEFEIQNTTNETLSYTLASTLRNPRGQSVNKFVQNKGVSAIHFTGDPIRYGKNDPCDLTLATDETEGVSYQENWYRGGWFDSLETYWRNFTEKSVQENRKYETPGNCDHGSLYIQKEAKPGEKIKFRVILSWNCPNRYNYWDKYTKQDESGAEIEVPMINYYATNFRNSFESAKYALKKWNFLYKKTKQYHDALFTSTLPDVVIEAISATTSVLKTETSIRINKTGDFYGWEGLWDGHGSCDGTCTHVWNYAYAMCFLFPEIERNIRENDYHFNQRTAGDMCFRTRIPFGRGIGGFRACVDGQMGGIIKIYREWKISGDNAWLTSLWPLVKKSMEFAWSDVNFDRWDHNQDGVLEGRQHHTLDMELFGPSSWLEGFYLCALKACAEMADVMGEKDFGVKCMNLFEKGKKWTDENLFNGEYFYQKVDLKDRDMLATFHDSVGSDDTNALNTYWNAEAGEIKYQIGEGCEIDQILAQWHADINGLGKIYDDEKVNTALKSIYKYNYKTTMRNHYNTFRLYAINDESGTIMCEFPKNAKKPAIPIPYAQETMHGFEYAFAGLLISRGFIEEGLNVIKSVRERYQGHNRNPWNEIECGFNYARSMASFALLPIFSGMHWDMTKNHISFNPIINKDNFSCLWSLSAGWGTFKIKKELCELSLSGGKISLKSISLPFSDVTKVIADGKEQEFSIENGTIILKETVTIFKKITVM